MIKDAIQTFFTYFKKSVGVLLFIACTYAIYKTIVANNNWLNYINLIRNLVLEVPFYQWLILFLLMLVNFSIESLKWKKVVTSSNPISFSNALKGVFVGQTFAFFTPNRIGEYAGRTLFLAAGNKLLGVAQLAWSSYAQLLVTLLIGCIALSINIDAYSWITGNLLYWVRVGVPMIGLLAFYLFFQQKKWTGNLIFLNSIQIETSLKWNLLLLSFGRYFVFLLQYIWVSYILKMDISILQLMLSISILFLFLSVLPTISLTELVIRGQLLLMILAPIYSDKMLIISLSSLIWGVNFLIPSIIGAFLLLGYRINR
jgi:putative Ca2+/H+ antiporter (TMEM165/GDT1 family)